MKATTNNSRYLQPAFLICVAVLALSAGGMSLARRKLGLYLKKEPLPLEKALTQMDEAALAPYVVVAKQTIANEEILSSLGTTDYIQWVLEDPSEPTDSAVRRIMLFVTYYPLPDRVPHVPEECYTGGGYRRLDTEEVTFVIEGPGRRRTVPGRYLVFGASQAVLTGVVPQFPVLYLFRINGEYAGTRNDARMALNRSLFSTHAYFSKVELVFNQSFTAPTKAQALAAGQRLLNVVLPLLEAEHWPRGHMSE